MHETHSVSILPGILLGRGNVAMGEHFRGGGIVGFKCLVKQDEHGRHLNRIQFNMTLIPLGFRLD